MNNELTLIIFLVIVYIIFTHYFEPRVDIITEKDSYKVLLWYNKQRLNEGGCTRDYIELVRVKKWENKRTWFY
jgi:hypothetical protein